VNKMESIKKYALLYIAFLVYSVTTVFAKFAAQNQILSVKFILFLGMEFLALGIYAVLWQQVLKKFSLITAMSSKGIVVIFSLFWAVIIFNESITLTNIIGIILIVLGIWKVSKDE